MTLTENRQKTLLGTTAGIILVLFILQSFALYVDLYGMIWWFDNFMHFWGGFFLGYFIITLLAKYKPEKITVDRKFFIKILIGVFIIGFAWEIYEYVVDIFIAQNGPDYIDIATDLFFDTFGGAVALFLIRKFNLKQENE